MSLTISARQLVEQANAQITTLPLTDAQALAGNPDVQFVDIRDVRELEREGMIEGAFHAPRGMLEFWIDPDSPYFKPIFGEPKQFVFYCQSGWRSALATATVQHMGLTNVSHIEGGFSAWKKAGLTVASKS